MRNFVKYAVYLLAFVGFVALLHDLWLLDQGLSAL